MSPHAFYSHETAARLWGFPLPSGIERGLVQVSVEKPSRAPRLLGVVGHHCEPGAVRVVERQGMRVSSAVETWCALSTVLELDDLIVAGDWLLRRKNPLATVELLHQRVAAFSGRPGAPLLRRAAAMVRARTDSPRETRLRLALVRGGLPEPEVNLEIRDAEGRFVAFGDLAYASYRVLVEYDGEQHRVDDTQYHRDVNRLDDIMQLEWRVARIDKKHADAVAVSRVAAALRSRGWAPASARRGGAKSG